MNLFATLREVGRTLSSKNEARIRSASEALNEVLGDIGELSEADRSLQQTLLTVERAVSLRFSNDTQYAYVSDIYESTVVVTICVRGQYRSDDVLYQMPYTLNADDTVTFGDAVQVVRRVVYEPVAATDIQEAALTGEPVDLVERALRPDGTGRIKIIAPGWGSSGYYPADVLQRDGPKAFTSGMHMYVDHPTQTERRDLPERSVERLAAVTTSDATWQESGSDGPGLYADIQVAQTYREHINDLANHIGVSIMARGNAEMGEAEGRKGLIVKSINQADSIDFVTRAGAGGAILPLIEARRNNPLSTEEPETMSKELLDRLDKLEAENKRLREAQLQAQAVVVIQESLASHNLPANVSQRVAASLRVDVPADGVLDVAALKESVKAAVATELQYIESLKIPAANLREAGQPRGVGSSAPANQSLDLAEAFKSFGLNAEAAKIAAGQ